MKILWVIYRRKLTVFYSQLLGYKVLSLRKKQDTQERTQYKNNKCLLFAVLFTVLLFFFWLCRVLVVACGIQFPNQESNPGPSIESSQPLDHQGRPLCFYYYSLLCARCLNIISMNRHSFSVRQALLFFLFCKNRKPRLREMKCFPKVTQLLSDSARIPIQTA